jgi:hypothetical protein
MSNATVASWDPALRARAGALAVTRLRESLDDADAAARTLAPDGPGPGVRFHVYGESLDSPRDRVAYQTRFTGIDELLTVLEAGDPGALELALEILSRIDPEAAVPIAELLLPYGPWKPLGSTIGHVLSRCASERSFRLLVDHPEVPYLRDGLATNGWAGGVAEAWSIVRSVDLHARDLDPRVRVNTLPLVSYLLRHDPEPAFEALVALLDASQVNVYVAHTLARDPRGRDVLLRDLERAPPGASLRFSQELAVKLLLERDPRSVVDALGGSEFLAAPGGRPRLRALVSWLRHDTWNAKRDPGGPRGWLATDPRFAVLLGGLRRDPERELAGTARDLLATLPKEARPKAPKRAKKTAPVQVAPDAALVAEMAAIRDALARIVQHLRATKYRFANPRNALAAPKAGDLKALARLEKRVVVPPVLAAMWRTIGSVDLRGEHRSWPVAGYLGFPDRAEPVWLTDPIVIAPAAGDPRSARRALGRAVRPSPRARRDRQGRLLRRLAHDLAAVRRRRPAARPDRRDAARAPSPRARVGRLSGVRVDRGAAGRVDRGGPRGHSRLETRARVALRERALAGRLTRRRVGEDLELVPEHVVEIVVLPPWVIGPVRHDVERPARGAVDVRVRAARLGIAVEPEADAAGDLVDEHVVHPRAEHAVFAVGVVAAEDLDRMPLVVADDARVGFAPVDGVRFRTGRVEPEPRVRPLLVERAEVDLLRAPEAETHPLRARGVIEVGVVADREAEQELARVLPRVEHDGERRARVIPRDRAVPVALEHARARERAAAVRCGADDRTGAGAPAIERAVFEAVVEHTRDPGERIAGIGARFARVRTDRAGVRARPIAGVARARCVRAGRSVAARHEKNQRPPHEPTLARAFAPLHDRPLTRAVSRCPTRACARTTGVLVRTVGRPPRLRGCRPRSAGTRARGAIKEGEASEGDDLDLDDRRRAGLVRWRWGVPAPSRARRRSLLG